MKFKCFLVNLLLKRYKFHQFFGRNIYGQNVPIPANHVLPTYNKTISTTFANFVHFYAITHHLAPSFYYILLPCPNFVNFLLFFISTNWSYNFFFIFWQAPIPPSCRIPCLFNKECFF